MLDIKESEMLDIKESEMLDINEPRLVNIIISADAKTIWVDVNDLCELRVCKIINLSIKDNSALFIPKPTASLKAGLCNDDGKWYVIDDNGDEIAGPFEDEIDAQRYINIKFPKDGKE